MLFTQKKADEMEERMIAEIQTTGRTNLARTMAEIQELDGKLVFFDRVYTIVLGVFFALFLASVFVLDKRAKMI